MSHRRLVLTGTCIGAVTAGLLVATTTTTPENAPRDAQALSAVQRPPDQAPAGGPAPVGGASAGRADPGDDEPGEEEDGLDLPDFGAFLGSGPEGVRRIEKLEKWLDGREPTVGHTYLPGDLWVNIEGKRRFLEPWAEWTREKDDRMFVLNVPMLERNEDDLPDEAVDHLLRAGARGHFDHHFRRLGERLVDLGVEETVVVLGWEMNGTTYTSRCAPNPEAWKTYWRNIVSAMRSVPGQDFEFDFAPARGEDAIAWTKCYPGDPYVDIIGMDSYDQPPGTSFREQVNQPYGLKKQVEFAREHDKEISYPEWGLFRDGDNPEYMRKMLEWIRRHDPEYHTITDYCPHGVMQCGTNPESSDVFRELMADVAELPDPFPTTPTGPEQEPDVPWWKPEPVEFCVDLGDWIQDLLDTEPLCFKFDGDLGL
ncbi:glycosyl hydrolase family 26 [Streptomyces sp. RKND-216]|uniref:glycoside hydrolase family 26 protein n=1 Tax=Streptomyces sp. RKND-216 TaxID=2562581 RepID=UPI00109DBD02|nr:glycosyl hydrolase [Streptomyces sp. RKND-216]THA23846.1 glycosyl hydrolase family 26 [Streptomyces sp. RKND-216]